MEETLETLFKASQYMIFLYIWDYMHVSLGTWLDKNVL